jgi:hypothetical protein
MVPEWINLDPPVRGELELAIRNTDRGDGLMLRHISLVRAHRGRMRRSFGGTTTWNVGRSGWASAFGEELEARNLCSASTELGSGLVADLPRSWVAAEPTAAARECPSHLVDIAEGQRVPAPIRGDYNLDGYFSTGDIVSLFQSGGRSFVERQDVGNVVEQIDAFAEARQLFPYENRGDYGPGSPCIVYQLAARLDSPPLTQQHTPYPDGKLPKESAVIVGPPESPTYRAAMYYDDRGNLKTSSLDIYRHDSTPYSRSQTEYDDAGRIVGHLTWLFSADGHVRQTTTTSFFPDGPQVFRSTEVVELDEAGQKSFQQVHYFDDRSREIAREVYQFDAGRFESVTKVSLDVRGRPIHEFVVTDAVNYAGVYLPSTSGQAYLVQARDAVRTVSDALRPAYAELLRMNSLPAQDSLTAVLQAATLTAAQSQRYRTLNQYFELCKDVARALQEGDFSPLYGKYASLIDVSTGAWKPSFEKFAEAERLTLPFAPLRIATEPGEFNVSQAATYTPGYHQLLGDNPAGLLQSLRQNPESHVDKLLESMRRVKAVIKLVQYASQGSYPAFDWWSAQMPDGETVGLEQIVPLTGWYFFEQRDDGSYINDTASESTLRQRVLNNMTNEDVFYVMNLEHWDLDGSPAETEVSLGKLKRTADLIHQFNPNLLIGFYRLLPHRDPVATYDGATSSEYQAWQSRNDHVAAALEDSIDIVFPSLYVMHRGDETHTTEERWSRYAEESVAEARRIGDGKPVIPFLALHYQPNGLDATNNRPNNLNAWQLIEPNFLLFQMAKLDAIADGFVLYYQSPGGGDATQPTELLDTIAMFQEVQRKGAVGQLRNFFYELLVSQHDELIERQTLERQLDEMLWEQEKAMADGDPTRYESLALEIRILQYRLRAQVEIWPEVESYVRQLK